MPNSCFTHSVTLGLFLAHYVTFSSGAEVLSVGCKSVDVSSKYRHCGRQADGVTDLDCFHKGKTYKCVWKPGKHTWKTTYTLVIQQENINYCRVFSSITEMSQGVSLFQNYNMTAEVLEHTGQTDCTKAVFRGEPKNLWRCGPPSNVTFKRRPGGLDVHVTWLKEDVKNIRRYSVRYKAAGSRQWSESSVQSRDSRRCSVENLDSSLVYIVQLRCVADQDKCSQCLWSDSYSVPPELTAHPVITKMEDKDVADQEGGRMLSLAWTFPSEELHDGYFVTIGKESGELSGQRLTTTQPQIMLILSYSAYHVNISAFNNASVSPAVSRTIPQRALSVGGEKLRVTVIDSTSFRISWKDDLIRTYVCFSVELTKKWHKAVSFYEDENNFFHFNEPLEPYQRYGVALHTRPDQDTCNLKSINNTERTYASTQFYFQEGVPVGAPTNISSHNLTLDSMVLQWTSIPEDDIRGFLLGYIIHYVEYHHRETQAERNVTVDPRSNSYEVGDLKSNTVYQVQILGFTREGPGVRSTPCLFKTNHQGSLSLTMVVILVIMAVLVIFGSPLIKRAKIILWPSIPNPGNSNTMQKIGVHSQLELLESINTLKVEEWDTRSLQIVEERPATPVSTLPSMLPLLHDSEDEEHSPRGSCNWDRGDKDDATGDSPPGVTADTFSDLQRTNIQNPPNAFFSGYTTMEMFQQGLPAHPSESKPEDGQQAGLW